MLFNRIIFKYTFIIFYVLKWEDLTKKKDSGKQFVFCELTYIGAELALHKLCGDLFHIVYI